MNWKRQPHRVLMTADTIVGVWTYAIELVSELGEHGVDVMLATMGAPLNENQRAQVQGLANLQLRERDYRLEWMPQAWADVERAGVWLRELESEFHPDVIHLNGYAHGALPWAAPVLVVGHSCVLSWWQAVKGEPAPVEWSRYHQEARRGLQAAQCVVAPTQAMMHELYRHYGPLPPQEVIFNGRDVSLFHATVKEPFVLSVGRLWDEAKNVQLLCAIAEDLPWPVKVAGDATAPDGGTLDLPHVQCLGRCGEAALADLYSRAGIYALPARYEPFGLSALEAGLSGCALVLGDIPSLREVWGTAAHFVAPDDAEAWRKTLRDLMDEPAQVRELGEAARQRALQFSATECAARYLELYRRLLRTFHPTSEQLTAVAA